VPAACKPADTPSVTLYVSADQHVAREVVAAFEAESGLRVDVVGDTEVKKTTGLVQRLRRERDHPQADVFWSSERTQTIALADEGLLVPHESATTRERPDDLRDPEGRWHAFAARARVIVYAPDRVAEEEIPVTWTDLTRSHLRDRIVMADPRFGTTGGHLGAMKAFWDRDTMPGYYEAFLLGLRDNGTRLLPSGNAGVVSAVASGEADVGLTDTDDVWAAKTRGLAVAHVYPAHSHVPERGNGTMLIPNTVGVVAGAPHPAAAARLVDFLLSPAVERMLAESVSRNVPLRPEVAAEFPEHEVPNPLRVDPRRAAAARAEAVAMAMRILGGAEAGAEPSDAR
jgi:iron(III) transport system substrate-binding protein